MSFHRCLIISIFCAGICVSADDICLDSEAKSILRTEDAVLSPDSIRKAEAMASFAEFLYSAMNAPDRKKLPEATVDKLYNALEKDPESKEIIALVSADLAENSEKKTDRLKQLEMIAKIHPEILRLNLLTAGRLAAPPKGEKTANPETVRRAITLLNATREIAEEKGAKPEEQSALYSVLALLHSSLKEFSDADQILEDGLKRIPKEKRPELLQTSMSVYLEALKYASDDKPFLIGWFLDSDKKKYTEKFNVVSDEFSSILSAPESHLNAEAFLPSAAIFGDKGKNDLALLILTTPLYRNPNDRRAQLRLAAFYFASKNFANAARVWKRILEGRKKIHPVESYMYAVSLLNSGNPKEAAEAFANHRKRFPKDLFPLHQYAVSCFLSEDYAKAASILREIKKPIPESLYLLAVCEEKLGNHAAALDAFQKYAAVQKFNSKEERHPLLMQIIMIADKAKRYDVVTSMLEPMMNEDPENPEYLNLLGYIYAEAGIHLNRAEELLRKAVVLAPDNPAILDSMAWLLYRQKKFEEAWKTIQKSLSAFPQGIPADAVILDHAGDICAALGKKTEAVDFWKQALSVYSEEINRENILKKLKNAEKI